MKPKIIRACTVSMSITFVEGMLENLKQKYEVVLLSSPGSEMEEARVKHGVETVAIPMERHISLNHDMVSLWRIAKVLHREKPAIVHSMTPKAGLLCMVAAWLTRVPVRVHTFTGLVFPTATGLRRRLLMATDWLTCACATHIIPEGEGVKNDLISNGITRKPLRVLGHGNVKGIDLSYYSKEKVCLDQVISDRGQVISKGRRTIMKDVNLDTHNSKLITQNLNNKCFTFLFVGRIVRDKGINELVAAFLELNKNYPATKLLLVGRFEDDLDPVSEKTRATIDKCKDIEAVGEKLGDELLAYYAAADCYVFPSYREGFPNTVLEAGAMGLPCIVTDINGSREIMRNENLEQVISDRGQVRKEKLDLNGKVDIRTNGIVIPPKDKQALYDAMEWMMVNEDSRKRMEGNARRMIAERFEQGYVRQCLIDFYDEILKNKP